jgi:hypothetical protein
VLTVEDEDAEGGIDCVAATFLVSPGKNLLGMLYTYSTTNPPANQTAAHAGARVRSRVKRESLPFLKMTGHKSGTTSLLFVWQAVQNPSSIAQMRAEKREAMIT